MRRVIEATHVSLGGEVGTIDGALPYLDDEHREYVDTLLAGAEALLLGRKTFEGLSRAYPRWRPPPRARSSTPCDGSTHSRSTS